MHGPHAKFAKLIHTCVTIDEKSFLWKIEEKMATDIVKTCIYIYISVIFLSFKVSTFFLHCRWVRTIFSLLFFLMITAHSFYEISKNFPFWEHTRGFPAFRHRECHERLPLYASSRVISYIPNFLFHVSHVFFAVVGGKADYYVPLFFFHRFLLLRERHSLLSSLEGRTLFPCHFFRINW